MRLLPERIITYTLPVDSRALQAIEEYERAIDTVTPEELDALILELPTVTTLRLTIRQVSALRQGQYEMLRDEAHALVLEQTGRKADAIMKEGAAVGSAWAFLIDAYNAACMLASLSKLERSDTAYLGKPDKWDVMELPVEWRTLRDFLDSIPRRNVSGEPSLFDLWHDIALQVNPDLWIRRTDEAAKKFGAANVI